MHPAPKILVVDDSEDAAFLTQRLLRATGFGPPIATATGGVEAIELLRASAAHFDLVLLDIRMPRCDGFDVLKWIRAHSDLSGLLVVMLSTSDEERDLMQARQHGANGYVVKYPSVAELSEVFAKIAPEYCPAAASAVASTAPAQSRGSAWPFTTR